jgi:hypothetical protein
VHPPPHTHIYLHTTPQKPPNPHVQTHLEGERGPQLLAGETTGELGVVSLQGPGPHDIVEERREGAEGRDLLFDEGWETEVEVCLCCVEVGGVVWEGPRLEAFDGVL